MQFRVKGLGFKGFRVWGCSRRQIAETLCKSEYEAVPRRSYFYTGCYDCSAVLYLDSGTGVFFPQLKLSIRDAPSRSTLTAAASRLLHRRGSITDYRK